MESLKKIMYYLLLNKQEQSKLKKSKTMEILSIPSEIEEEIRSNFSNFKTMPSTTIPLVLTRNMLAGFNYVESEHHDYLNYFYDKMLFKVRDNEVIAVKYLDIDIPSKPNEKFVYLLNNTMSIPHKYQ